jgi:hypothetical protein
VAGPVPRPSPPGNPQPPPLKRKPAPRRKPPQKPPPRSQPPPAGAQPKQQPPPQPPPATPPPAPLLPAQLIAAIISALGAALTAAQLVRLLAKIMALAGIGLLALRAVAVLLMSWPPDVLEGTGPAQRHAIRTNTTRRAQFMLSACKRVQAAIVAARSQGTPVLDAIRKAMALEQRWLALHVQMSTRRIRAACAVDGLAETYGNLLGWNAIIDAATTPGCRLANGQNFRADRPPYIEGSPSLPGAVHEKCRCWASAAHKGAPILP